MSLDERGARPGGKRKLGDEEGDGSEKETLSGPAKDMEVMPVGEGVESRRTHGKGGRHGGGSSKGDGGVRDKQAEKQRAAAWKVKCDESEVQSTLVIKTAANCRTEVVSMLAYACPSGPHLSPGTYADLTSLVEDAIRLAAPNATIARALVAEVRSQVKSALPWQQLNMQTYLAAASERLTLADKELKTLMEWRAAAFSGGDQTVSRWYTMVSPDWARPMNTAMFRQLEAAEARAADFQASGRELNDQLQQHLGGQQQHYQAPLQHSRFQSIPLASSLPNRGSFSGQAPGPSGYNSGPSSYNPSPIDGGRPSQQGRQDGNYWGYQ